jgi:hypothetical protein
MRSIIQQEHAGVIQLLVGTSRFHKHMWDLVHVLVFFLAHHVRKLHHLKVPMTTSAENLNELIRETC